MLFFFYSVKAIEKAQNYNIEKEKWKRPLKGEKYDIN